MFGGRQVISTPQNLPGSTADLYAQTAVDVSSTDSSQLTLSIPTSFVYPNQLCLL